MKTKRSTNVLVCFTLERFWNLELKVQFHMVQDSQERSNLTSPTNVEPEG